MSSFFSESTSSIDSREPTSLKKKPHMEKNGKYQSKSQPRKKKNSRPSGGKSNPQRKKKRTTLPLTKNGKGKEVMVKRSQLSATESNRPPKQRKTKKPSLEGNTKSAPEKSKDSLDVRIVKGITTVINLPEHRLNEKKFAYKKAYTARSKFTDTHFGESRIFSPGESLFIPKGEDVDVFIKKCKSLSKTFLEKHFELTCQEFMYKNVEWLQSPDNRALYATCVFGHKRIVLPSGFLSLVSWTKKSCKTKGGEFHLAFKKTLDRFPDIVEHLKKYKAIPLDMLLRMHDSIQDDEDIKNMFFFTTNTDSEDEHAVMRPTIDFRQHLDIYKLAEEEIMDRISVEEPITPGPTPKKKILKRKANANSPSESTKKKTKTTKKTKENGKANNTRTIPDPEPESEHEPEECPDEEPSSPIEEEDIDPSMQDEENTPENTVSAILVKTWRKPGPSKSPSKVKSAYSDFIKNLDQAASFVPLSSLFVNPNTNKLYDTHSKAGQGLTRVLNRSMTLYPEVGSNTLNDDDVDAEGGILSTKALNLRDIRKRKDGALSAFSLIDSFFDIEDYLGGDVDYEDYSMDEEEYDHEKEMDGLKTWNDIAFSDDDDDDDYDRPSVIKTRSTRKNGSKHREKRKYVPLPTPSSSSEEESSEEDNEQEKPIETIIVPVPKETIIPKSSTPDGYRYPKIEGTYNSHFFSVSEKDIGNGKRYILLDDTTALKRSTLITKDVIPLIGKARLNREVPYELFNGPKGIGALLKEAFGGSFEYKDAKELMKTGGGTIHSMLKNFASPSIHSDIRKGEVAKLLSDIVLPLYFYFTLPQNTSEMGNSKKLKKKSKKDEDDDAFFSVMSLSSEDSSEDGEGEEVGTGIGYMLCNTVNGSPFVEWLEALTAEMIKVRPKMVSRWIKKAHSHFGLTVTGMVSEKEPVKYKDLEEFCKKSNDGKPSVNRLFCLALLDHLFCPVF